METNKFKVGDKVRGNSDNYSYTNYDMTLGEVIEVINKDEIRVKVLKHRDNCQIGKDWRVESQDFVSAEFTKKDLQDGDIVTLRNGARLSYCSNNGVFMELDDKESYLDYIMELNKDLTCNCSNKDSDIVKVERPTTYTTVYEREEKEVKEMTIAEISKALGYEVKIVKETE